MSSREEILDRVRKALGRMPGAAPPAPGPRDALPELGQVLPPISPEELVSKFERELEQVGGNTHRAANPQELEAILRSVLDGAGAKRVVLSRHPLLSKLALASTLQSWGKSVSAWLAPAGADAPDQALKFREQAFSAEVGITGVDWVLAESGTLILSSLTEGAQLASLAPPVHVALYRHDQVVGSLEEVLERLPVPRDPHTTAPGRSVVFITGSSRTADIEQILVHGVHGPREVHAILIEDSCLS